jgi:serine/threonine-protein kinase RsbW
VADTHPFRLQNDLAEVPPLRERFERECSAAGVDDEDKQSSVLAFTELVNNSIEHGCSRATDVVEGWYRITEIAIECEVTDPGEVLTLDDFNNADASAFVENGRGAGLLLIRAMSDEVDVRPSPGGGTTVRILKRRRLGAAS